MSCRTVQSSRLLGGAERPRAGNDGRNQQRSRQTTCDVARDHPHWDECRLITTFLQTLPGFPNLSACSLVEQVRGDIVARLL
jgi:hypothetical protein